MLHFYQQMVTSIWITAVTASRALNYAAKLHISRGESLPRITPFHLDGLSLLSGMFTLNQFGFEQYSKTRWMYVSVSPILYLFWQEYDGDGLLTFRLHPKVDRSTIDKWHMCYSGLKANIVRKVLDAWDLLVPGKSWHVLVHIYHLSLWSQRLNECLKLLSAIHVAASNSVQ